MCCNLRGDIGADGTVNGSSDAAAERESEESTDGVLVRSTMRHRLKERNRNDRRTG